MTHLPVPDLDQTLERYLDAVRPLLDDAEFATTRRVVREFAQTDGPACQDALLAFAETENEQERSWLSEEWLAVYLAGRSPLTLLSSVGFEVFWPAGDHGTTRAANLAHAVADVHLTHLRGELTPQVGPHGEALCMQQWRYLAGGLRHPQTDHDVVIPGATHPANREIVVIRGDEAFAVAISDENGRVRPAAHLRDAFDQIVAAPRGGGVPFAAWSYLGSERATFYQEIAFESPENVATYERLTHALFVLNLAQEEVDATAHLRRTAFGYGQSWVYKPVTFQVSLVDDFVGMHIEHSTVDGGTLKAGVALAQLVHDRERDADAPDHDVGKTGHDCGHACAVPDPTPLRWSLPDEGARRLTDEIAQYVQEARRYQSRTTRPPLVPTHDLPFKLSHDAYQQFVMLYAQLRAFGRIRSTYEAVDMREYVAGRTETLRPNTVPAVDLVRSLLHGRADLDQLRAALDAHRTWVKRCKAGAGIDRHLFGLRVHAKRLGLDPAIFFDEGYRRLTSDFLSTTSLGGPEEFLRFTFAPTVPGGIGIGYSPHENEYDFTLTYDEEARPDIDLFVDALQEGARLLAELIDSAR